MYLIMVKNKSRQQWVIATRVNGVEELEAKLDRFKEIYSTDYRKGRYSAIKSVKVEIVETFKEIELG